MRQVTQTKRSVGFIKKSMEMAILCDCEVSMILINEQGIANTFSSTGDHQGTIDRVNSFPPSQVKNILLEEVLIYYILNIITKLTII